MPERTDTDRLNWLEKVKANVWYSETAGDRPLFGVYFDTTSAIGDTLRDAIDSAYATWLANQRPAV